MQQIKQGIYFEDAYTGVTLGALVYPRGTIMIDAPLHPEHARSWSSALFNQRGGMNRALISLDDHLDRTLGARALECTIITHQETAQKYRSRPTIFKGHSIESGSDWEIYNDAIGTRWAIPDITFTQRMSMYWGEPEIILEHHPGPTSGAIWVIIPSEQVIYVGDAVVPNQPPFLADANLSAWIESLDAILTSYQDFLIISGRGGPVPNEVVRAQYNFLKNITRRLERLAKRKAPPEATNSQVSSLLSKLTFPPEQGEQYTKRLRFGLYQYYLQNYHSENSGDQIS